MLVEIIKINARRNENTLQYKVIIAPPHKQSFGVVFVYPSQNIPIAFVKIWYTGRLGKWNSKEAQWRSPASVADSDLTAQ